MRNFILASLITLPTLITSQVVPGGGGTNIAPLYITDANTVEQYNGTTQNNTRFSWYSQRSSISDYERISLSYTAASNVWQLRPEGAGSGIGRPLIIYDGPGNQQILLSRFTNTGVQIGAGSFGGVATRLLVGEASDGLYQVNSGTHTGLGVVESYRSTGSSTLVFLGANVHPTVNFAGGGSGSYEALRISPIETNLGTGVNYLIRAMAGAAGTTDIWSVDNNGTQRNTGLAFANLPGTPSNGMFLYCTNCTIANPCASGGSGAFAKRLNGVWVCN